MIYAKEALVELYLMSELLVNILVLFKLSKDVSFLVFNLCLHFFYLVLHFHSAPLYLTLDLNTCISM